MLIDCDNCEVRGLACSDCVVTVLLGSTPDEVQHVEVDADEQRAIEVLADAGMIPPLRLVTAGVATHDHAVASGDTTPFAQKRVAG